MAANNDRTTLLAPRPENIPEELKARARWACWRATWNAKGHGGKGKWDKVPVHPKGFGLSTRRPDAWVSYEEALAAYQANPKGLAGVGYLMTGDAGVVGIDLDRCIEGNQIAPWAQEIIDGLGSYTELSPSGQGLRIFVQGEVAFDWNNHDVGIEVYAGHTPRFLTVTGHRLRRSSNAVATAPEGVLSGLAQRHARERETATAISLAMPDLVDELGLPDVLALDLPYPTADFLRDGSTGSDRSRSLFTAAVDLFAAGLDEATVLSVLAANPHAMGIALDHRRQDHDRALMYLWVEHTQKARGRAMSRIASADDFEDLSGSKPTGETPAQAKPLRFAFTQAADYAAHRPPVRWLVKRVLPQAEVGVIFGESGAGKSFFALDLVVAVARGLPWRDRQTAQGTVAYVCAEGAGGFALRLQALSDFHGVDLADMPLHVLAEAPNLLQKQDVGDLIAGLRALPTLSIIVVDTLAQVTPGANENGGEDMGRALAHCKAIHKATGAMVLLVAHAGKDTSRGIRGWSGIKGALDVELSVERSGEHRAATVTKMKDGLGEGDEHPFTLESVVLGQDEDGEDITSCVVKASPGGLKARKAAEPKGAVQKLVLRVAEGLVALADQVPVTTLIESAANELPAPDAGKRDKRREHVMRALESLVAVGAVSAANGVVQMG